MSDPLEELKREIERECRQSVRPRIEIDLDRDYAVRGERVSGRVVVTAGEGGLDVPIVYVRLDAVRVLETRTASRRTW